MEKSFIKEKWGLLLSNTTFRNRGDISAFDGRNPFENDYSRLISSSFIRRLQGKTQVFPLSDSDFIRTRLTHSLEVSSIARSIGASIEKKLIEGGLLEPKYSGHLSSLLMTAGLIHDLGNPPFGHYGEHSIQSYFQKNIHHLRDFTPQEENDFKFFDGNVQTLRILLKLQYFGDAFSYNLTYPTLAAIIKYPRSSTDGNKGKENRRISEKKFGFFVSEKIQYEEINHTLKLNGERHPATFLLEAADDIAYSAADIEDGAKLGIIDYESIRGVFLSKFGEDTIVKKLDEYYYIFLNTGKDRLGLTVQKFRVYTQSLMIESILKEFENNIEEIISGEYKFELLSNCDQKAIRDAYKDISTVVFTSPIILEPEMAGNEVLTGLLEMFINASESQKFQNKGNNTESRLYNLIASNYRHIYEYYSSKSYQNERYNKIQLILDFVSGMTDGYALKLYQKLKGIKI